MIIIVNNIRINTDDIKNITNLNNPLERKFDDNWDSDDDERDWLYNFEIIKFDGKSYKFAHINRDHIYPIWYKIMKIWLKNRLNPPTFKI